MFVTSTQLYSGAIETECIVFLDISHTYDCIFYLHQCHGVFALIALKQS